MGVAGIVVRPAVPGDSADLERLINQLGYEASQEDIAAGIAEIRTDGREVLVAELAGLVVGCLSTSIMRVLHRPKPVGRISMMVVADGLRGQGIGAALVRAAEEWLAGHACGLVEVTSNNKRTEAHRFYEKLGYEKTSARFAKKL